MSRSNESAPILVRLAGLPAAAVQKLGSDLPDTVRRIASLEADCERLRQACIDRLYSAISEATSAERRFLLQVKRDTFNGRPLSPHRGHKSWVAVAAVLGDEAELILDIEAELSRLRQRFAADYKTTVVKTRQLLAAWLRHSGFRSGLAIASPELARNSERLLRCAPTAYGRRERRLESTLARYISRATCKLSPFASFTLVGLADLVECDSATPISVEPMQSYSLVRIKRYLLDQCISMLKLYPPFRLSLGIALNDSAVKLTDGRYLFLRSSQWKPDEESDKLKWHPESSVKARLQGPLFERLQALLGEEDSDGRLPYHQLLGNLSATYPQSQVEQTLNRLIDIGFLQTYLPWPSDEGYLEKRILAELSRYPSTPELSYFLSCLERLVTLEESFHVAADPAATLAELESSIDQLWQAAAPLGTLDPQKIRYRRVADYNIYQDVMCTPAGSVEGTSIAELDVSIAHRLLTEVEPLRVLSTFFDPRIEFLLAIDDFAVNSLKLSEVRFIELFDVAQPLWQEFVRYQIATRSSEEWPRTWNPSQLDTVAELHSLRCEVWKQISACLEIKENEQVINSKRLNALLLKVPPIFQQPALGGLFVQPVSTDGSLWVLNRLKEGTGRFSSRYTPAMSDATKFMFTGALTARGGFKINGEVVQLLDICYPNGDTLNVHAPQTPAVLVLPGANSSAPAERQRNLSELRVVFSEHDLPQIRDSRDQRFLPIQLGVGFYDYLPTVVKFLCAFGPNELSAVYPPPLLQHQEDGGAVSARTRIGSVIIRRRTWTCPAHPLRDAIENEPEAVAFEQVNRWRYQRDIPAQVFLIERVGHPIKGDRVQPQYLDFTSPLFVNILRSALQSNVEDLVLVEMIPTPEQYPRNQDGEHRAVEFLLDGIALQPELPVPVKPIISSLPWKIGVATGDCAVVNGEHP